MQPTNICKLCKKINHGTWVLKKTTTGMTKICKRCSEISEDSLSVDFSERNKKRVEQERKAKNAEIVRQLKNNTYHNPK